MVLRSSASATRTTGARQPGALLLARAARPSPFRAGTEGVELL